MGEISLIGEWLATWGDGLHGKFEHALLPMEDPSRYIKMQFPGSVQKNLISLGLIDDPRIGLNSLKSRWVEEHFWILRKTFFVAPEVSWQSPWLLIEILDGPAKVFLNGLKVGEFENSHYPAEMDLSWAIQAGNNELVILLESGLFSVADLPAYPYSSAEETLLNKRQHLRQPQYQFGWDWNPRLIYFGMHGDIRVLWGDTPRLRQVSVITEVSPDLANSQIRLKTDWFVPGRNIRTIILSITSRDGLNTHKEINLFPGNVVEEIILDVSEPKLWWPRGHGTQELYPLQLIAEEGNVIIDRWIGHTGLRRIEIAQPPHPEKGNYFHILINNQRIFCKGANWVPPEMSAYEVDPDKIAQLINLAIEQNFTMFRIWGGAIWAGHTLLDLCDQAGILVWHDLLFACAKYPADRPDFLKNVRKELYWGFQEFSPHPSLVVWCGNNEIEEGLWSWHYQDFGVTAPDYVLFHHVIPSILTQVDPTRPYWPSSPYSAPDINPQDPTRGDQHPWSVSLHHDAQASDFWRYRQFEDRFPDEGGVLGISPVKSLKEFLPGSTINPRSFDWEHHDNSVSFWRARPGIGYQMVQEWFGIPVDELTAEQLSLASGLVQAEGLKEYIRNYRRRWPDTSAAIYWDYVDSWPSVHGWGTLDYYLRRKPSFYSVKRANQPIIVVLSDDSKIGEIGIYLVNDTPFTQVISLEAGNFSSSGPRQKEIEIETQISPFSSSRVSRLPYRVDRIAYAIIRKNEGKILDWDRILLQRPFTMDLVPSKVTINKIRTKEGSFARYESEDWVLSVVIDQDGEGKVEDNIFDLFPGIPYDIPLKWIKNPLPVLTTGNDLINSNKQI